MTFRRQTLPERKPMAWPGPQNFAPAARCDGAGLAQPKTEAVRSEPYRRLVAACSVDGCESPSIAKGLCNRHYLRARAHGQTELPPRPTVSELLASGSLRTEGGCLEWQKGRREGYGRVWVGRRLFSAHVVAWEVVNGPVPKDKQINHKCHNRACIDVAHLYVGDQVQNMADMRSAGRERRPKGQETGTAKLTEQDVISIRASDKGAAHLSREYGVSESLIRAVKKREVWAWLEQPSMLFEKSAAVRHEGYRRLVAQLACKACGIQGYSQAAHLPPDGKGVKQDDRLIFPLCCTRVGIAGCHADYDQYRMFTHEVALTVGMAWAMDTTRAVMAAGNWPANLPVYLPKLPLAIDTRA